MPAFSKAAGFGAVSQGLFRLRQTQEGRKGFRWKAFRRGLRFRSGRSCVPLARRTPRRGALVPGGHRSAPTKPAGETSDGIVDATRPSTIQPTLPAKAYAALWHKRAGRATMVPPRPLPVLSASQYAPRPLHFFSGCAGQGCGALLHTSQTFEKV